MFYSRRLSPKYESRMRGGCSVHSTSFNCLSLFLGVETDEAAEIVIESPLERPDIAKIAYLDLELHGDQPPLDEIFWVLSGTRVAVVFTIVCEGKLSMVRASANALILAGILQK